jgi:hypothetical protein
MAGIATTPAMRAWCEALAKPEVCCWVRRGAILTMSGSLLKRGPRHSIVRSLEDAGLIEWDHFADQSTARLTLAGQRAAFRSPTIGKTFNVPSPFKRKRKQTREINPGTPVPSDEVRRLNAIMIAFQATRRAGI